MKSIKCSECVKYGISGSQCNNGKNKERCVYTVLIQNKQVKIRFEPLLKEK